MMSSRSSRAAAARRRGGAQARRGRIDEQAALHRSQAVSEPMMGVLLALLSAGAANCRVLWSVSETWPGTYERFIGKPHSQERMTAGSYMPDAWEAIRPVSAPFALNPTHPPISKSPINKASNNNGGGGSVCGGDDGGGVNGGAFPQASAYQRVPPAHPCHLPPPPHPEMPPRWAPHPRGGGGGRCGRELPVAFVVGDNIDTDQIIPAEHLTLVPSKPDEYRKLGSFAFAGLPSAAYPTPFVAPGEESTRYAVIVGGANFGCGSSREHAPVALGAAGARAVVAESYARIFFRNSVATGEVYPLELADAGAWKECKTGDVVTVDLGNSVFINHTSGKEYKLKPIGDAGPVIEAGGIFAYARKTGMIASKAAA
nr:unnamed protein product [Digitaria exilis]